jgi:hypothetical protein
MPNIRQSRDARLPKPEAMKLAQHKTTHTVELERVSSNIGNVNNNFNTKKERIPHSAYYMHKLHKRVSTAHNDGNRSLNQPVQSKGDIKDELKSFARKIIGGPSRLSSQN